MAMRNELDDIAYALVSMRLDRALLVPNSVDVLLARIYPDTDRTVVKAAIVSAAVDHVLIRMAMPNLTAHDCLGALHETRKINRDRAIEILFGRGATMEDL